MRVKRMHKRLSIALILFTVAVMVVFNESARPVWLRSVSKSMSDLLDPNQLYHRQDIDINANDVLVMVNIPLTGALALSDHIVRYSKLKRPCSCKHYRTKCQCLNPDGYQWLFNAYNTTGFVCGEDASYNEIKYRCPMDYWMRTTGKDKRPFRRYHLITMVREPIARYISEWKHLTTRDAYFVNEPRLWRKEPVEIQKKKLPCLLGKRMAAVTLDNFVNCPNNPANNRMTKMLANINYVNALNIQSEMKYKQALLLSAQNVLKRTAFFGLQHRLNDTQALLEEVLGVKLNKSLNLKVKTMDDVYKHMNPATKHKILMANDLDTKLYAFAKELFEARVAQWRQNHNKQIQSMVKKEPEEEKPPTVATVKASDTAKEDDDKEETKPAANDYDGEEEDKGKKNKEEDDEDEDEEDDTEMVAKKGEKAGEEEEGEDDEEEEDEKAKPKAPRPKPATSPTDGSPAKTAPGTGKTTDEGKSGGTKEGDVEKQGAKPSSATGGKSGTASSTKAGSPSGSAGSVKSTSDDVNEFFSKLEAAKENEGSKKTSTSELGDRAAKSSSASGSGTAKNPSLGEKFRQLQGHPTNQPDLTKQQDQNKQSEVKVEGGDKTSNDTVVSKTEGTNNESSKEQLTKDLLGKEQKVEVGKSLDKQETKAIESLPDIPNEKDLNVTVDDSLTTGKTLDAQVLPTNLSLEDSNDAFNQTAMDSTPAALNRLSTGLGQILTANEPQYRFDLADHEDRLGKTPSPGVPSPTDLTPDLTGAKGALDTSKDSPDKGLAMGEFNFGEGQPLEGTKDEVSPGEVASAGDEFSDKFDSDSPGTTGETLQSSLDANTNALEMSAGKVLSPTDTASQIDMKPDLMFEKDLGKSGVGLQTGVDSGVGSQPGVDAGKLNPLQVQDSSSTGDLGTQTGLDWNEQTTKEPVSSLDPGLKMDETMSEGIVGAGAKLSSKEGTPSNELSVAGGIGMGNAGAQSLPGKFSSQTASVETGLGGLDIDANAILEESNALSTDQGLYEVDLKGTSLESQSTRGIDSADFNDAQDLQMDESDAMLMGRPPARGDRFSSKLQGTMGNLRTRLPLDPDEVDSDFEQQLFDQSSNIPTARFRINPTVRPRAGQYRASRSGDFDGFVEQPVRARMGRTSSPGRRRTSRMRRGRRGTRSSWFPGDEPLTDDDKELRSMFV